MPPGTLRVAVCQLECHPALTLDDLDYLSEPTVPEPGGSSLASLSHFALDIADLQAQCADAYIHWHQRRLEHVLTYLSTLNPVPHLVVFPEGAVPLELLDALREFAATHQNTVFAGTHSLQLTHQNAQRYKQLGIDGKELKSWNERQRPCTAVLPIFSAGRSYFHLKSVPSVFERGDIRRDTKALAVAESFPLELAGHRVEVAAFVCAEALQRHQMPSKYDLIVVCAYNPSSDAFDPFTSQHVGTGVPVVIANDGRYGGSGVHILIDKRMHCWWWGEAIRGHLPPGDGILVVDIDRAHPAPQVGVADPHPPAQLVRCCAMTYEDATDNGFEASRLVGEAREQLDTTIQAELLSQVLEKNVSAIQRLAVAQLRRLADKGTSDVDWWTCLGLDCSITAQPDLAGLERSLSANAAGKLETILQAGDVQDERALGRIAKLLAHYRRKAGGAPLPTTTKGTELADVLIDREEECRIVRDWLSNPQAVICVLSGLSSVGKTRIIETAIRQGGYRHILRVQLVPDSTLEYLVASLLQQVGYRFGGGTENLQRLLTSVLQHRLARDTIVLLERAHHLMANFVWRDPDTPAIIDALCEVASAQQSTVLLESDHSLDLEPPNPAKYHRNWVRGLAQEDAVLLLDQHLRRAGLNPGHYSKEDRVAIATGLDGHPGAIILASEYVEQHGISQVVADIAARKGVHSRIVERIIKRLHITDEQTIVLSLLSVARGPVPALVIRDVTDFNAMRALRGLIQMALVERQDNDFVAITGLLRGFADLPCPSDKDLKRFHERAAAEYARVAGPAQSADGLRWAVEASYHAYSAGMPELAPSARELADGALGALQQLLDRGEYERARPIVDQLLRAHRTAEVLQLGALVYARLGRCEQALTLAKEAVSKQRQRVWILTEVGRCALFVGQDEIAEDAVRIAKATGTDDSYIAVLEGKLALRRARVDDAITAFQRGTEISCGDGWPHFFLGRTMLKQGDLDNAVNVLINGERIESARFRPRRRALAALRTQLAYAYLLRDDLEAAQKWLSIIVDEDRPNPEVARALAYVDLRSGRARFADAALARLDPSKTRNRHERAQVHLFRGLFYLNAGHRERASEEFSLASQADPRNIFVLLRWALVLLDIARDSAAEREHEAARVCAEQAHAVANKVLEFDRDNPEALRILESISDEFNVT